MARRFQTGSLGSQYSGGNTQSIIDYYENRQEEEEDEPSPPPPPPADIDDLPGTWNLMNQITATAGPELYPGLYNFADDVGFTEDEVQGYLDAVDTYYAGQGGAPPAQLPPILPPPPAGDAYKMFKWSEGGYEAAGGAAPDWWQAFLPEEVTPETAYGAMLNAMIPYLSPEDQVRTAHSLYGMFDTEMSHYKPGAIPEVSTVTEDQARYLVAQGRPVSGVWGQGHGEIETEPLSDQMRRYYMSSQRSKDAIRTLSNMREAMVQGNRWKLGPGYKWLQNILESTGARGASGATGQTRQDYLSMLSAVDPFLSQAGGGELQAFGPLGQMLSKPFFTSGALQPQEQGRFGRPNRRFF